MSVVYNPEAEIMGRIEALELESRDLRRKVEHACNAEDKKILNRQLDELRIEIQFLQSKLDKVAE